MLIRARHCREERADTRHREERPSQRTLRSSRTTLPRLQRLRLFCRHPWLLAWPCAANLGSFAARPPTLRVCARAVRATCRPRAKEVSLTASCRLRAGFAYAPTAARWRGLPPAACSASPPPPSGLQQGYRWRVSVMRHARPAAHTLRVVVRSAALSGSSAHVQSISQRGRQRLAAAVIQQPPHATSQPTLAASTSTRRPTAPTRSRLRAVTDPPATNQTCTTGEPVRAPDRPMQPV